MANDLIKVLLQAEIDSKAISNIQQQINSVEKNIKPIKVSVNASGTQGVTQMTDAFEKLEQVTKKNLMLDLERMSNRYKNLIKPDDIASIKSMINALEHTDPKLGHNIDLIKVKMKEVSVGAEQSKKSLDLANKSAMSFGEAMKQAAYKFGIWSAITASYYKVIREISTGIKFVTEMDTALTEIGMVTNQTREQTAGLAKEYNNLAKEMKVLTSEITSGAVEFYRQGLSQEEVMERLKVTTMYSKIANVDFKQSAELLTATVNSMGVSIERAADVFLYLGDATATSGEEIGKGFSKTSGAAAALGVEFEKVASWIAIISSKTRESAESIGHSINTMLSRFSRITETGFNEEDDTKLNDVAKALNSVGIALTDQQGNFRNFGIIMDEINVKWAKLDDQTKSYIANTVAGTRQQSRFFNLMNGYAESMDLYEKSLESAGTAQSKFALYLESNQATLDKFRATLDGLWTTVVDSDSLMNIVRGATNFIEVLDSMVQKFGVIGSILNVVIPLIGVKLAWAIRSAYIEMIKLQATGSMTAFMPTTKVLGQIIAQMLGIKTAAGGATIAMSGLTLATAGLTLGIGLLTYGVMKWAQKSREAKEAFANALDNSQKINDEVKTLETLAKKQEELSKIENKSVEQKEELVKVQRELAQLYPELATGIDTEGNKIADNLKLTKQLTEEKRKLLEQELLVIKTTADQKLPQLREELADMQNEADAIQKRLASGDTMGTKTYMAQGRAIKIATDETESLKDRLLELVNAQKEHHEEITKLEDGVKSYNQILEENAEKQKWATVEELRGQAAKAQTKQELEAVEKKLKDLGFTSEDTANIISGNIDLVKEKYKELDMQQIINLQTIENLDATQKQAMMSMLESSKQATKQLIEDTKARIKAIMAEAQALVALTGGKVKNATVISKKQEIDPKNGLLSALATKAQNEAIDAQRELVNLEGNLKDIEKALANVSAIDTKQISGTRDPDKKKKKEEYKAEADRYAKINLELDKNNVLLQKNKTLQDLAGDDLAKKIPLMEEEIELNKQRQQTLHELNNEQRKELQELEKFLSGQGFAFAGEGDNRIITNLNHIQGKTKEVEEQFKRYIDLQSNLIPKVSQDWLNLSSSIQSTGKNLQDAIKNATREMIELEKRNAEMDLELRQREAQAKLDKAKARMEREVSSVERRIKDLQSEIDDIQAEEDARREREERQKRLTEIRQLEAKYYYLQNKNLSDLTEEQAKLVGLEKEREQYLERQAKLQELQIQLENTRREKNIQQLTKKADGTFDFIYVADQDKIDDINKQIEDLQKEHHNTITNLKETTLEQLKNAQTSYDEWERQNEIQRIIESKQRRIQEYQDEIKDLQDKYAKKERATNEAFAIEKENLNRHYMDMDILTNTALEQLKNTHDSNWTAIYNTLALHFNNIASDYDKLVAKLSTPLPTPSYSGGGGGYYTSSSSGSSGKGSSSNGDNDSVRAAKYAIDQNIKDWWEADKRGDDAAKKKASEQADKIRKDTGLNDYAKTKDEVDEIKKKYGFAGGGETSKTGLHWLDGKLGEPERILSATQTKDFNKLVEGMPDLLKAINITRDLFNNIKLPSIPNINPLNKSNSTQPSVNIEKVILPEVKDFNDFKKALINMPNIVIQEVKTVG